MEYTVYRTQVKDRWDIVAYKAYGDATLADTIMEANPYIPLYDVLPEGVFLIIPILINTTTLQAAALPPWRR